MLSERVPKYMINLNLYKPPLNAKTIDVQISRHMTSYNIQNVEF